MSAQSRVRRIELDCQSWTVKARLSTLIRRTPDFESLTEDFVAKQIRGRDFGTNQEF